MSWEATPFVRTQCGEFRLTADPGQRRRAWATDTALLAEADDDVRVAVTAVIPLGRKATATDIADMTLFLPSEHARHVTGQIVVVDGGSTLGVATR